MKAILSEKSFASDLDYVGKTFVPPRSANLIPNKRATDRYIAGISTGLRQLVIYCILPT